MYCSTSPICSSRAAHGWSARRRCMRASSWIPTSKIARTTVRAERIPFMAAEFVAGLLAPQTARAFPEVPGGWVPTAGELRAVRFDSGERRISPESWQLSAQVSHLELTRAADNATVAQLAVNVRRDARGLVLAFDPANTATLRMGATQEARSVKLAGSLARVPGDGTWRFEEFSAVTGRGKFQRRWRMASGREARGAIARGVEAGRSRVAAGLWTLVAADSVVPEPWSRIEQGDIVEGTLELAPADDGAGELEPLARHAGVSELAASRRRRAAPRRRPGQAEFCARWRAADIGIRHRRRPGHRRRATRLAAQRYAAPACLVRRPDGLAPAARHAQVAGTRTAERCRESRSRRAR